MAQLIVDEQQARRLARAIVSDIALYNEETLLAATSPRDALAEPIAEGRALFMSRVAPQLEGLFDQAVDSLLERRRPDGTAPSPTAAPTPAPTPPPAAPTTTVTPPTRPAPERRSAEAMFAELGRQETNAQPVAPGAPPRGGLMFGLALAALGAALAAAYLFSR